jgi:hypothetical protein
MTKLRTDFLAHLQLRGYAEATIKNYIQSVSLLARHHKGVCIGEGMKCV